MANVIYIIAAVLGLAIIIAGAAYFQYNANFWGKYYSAEVVRQINFAQPDQILTLDVHKATQVAKLNGVPVTAESMFFIDNEKNEFCVRLSKEVNTCYKYFNDIDIENPPTLELASGSKGETNLLIIRTLPKRTDKENEIKI